MGARDGVHDRQSEPRRAPRPRLVGAREALECAREEGWRKAVALVAHAERDLAVAGLRLQPDGARAVAKRVVDQVSECLLEAQPIGNDRLADGRGDGERTPVFFGTRREPPRNRLEQVADRDGAAAERQTAFVRPCQDEQVFGEARQAVDLLCGRGEGATQLFRRTRSSQRELELGLEQR